MTNTAEHFAPVGPILNRKTPMPYYYRDNKGRLIGNVRDEGHRKVYSNAKGEPVAFVRKESTGREITTAGNGQFVGFGDQALRLFK